LLAIVAGLASAGLAQSSARGAISGTVKDPTGAGVGGATVEVANQQTGVIERTLTTNAEGSFTATLLPIGVYRLTVTASGFAKTEAPNIRVNVTETTNVVATLKVGAVTEALVGELLPKTREILTKGGTKNLAAYDAYTRALEQLSANNFPSNIQAEALMKQALTLDTAYVDAMLGLVNTWLNMFRTGQITLPEFQSIALSVGPYCMFVWLESPCTY